jgi:hypothetical protein
MTCHNTMTHLPLLQPELTGGMMATSPPSPISLSPPCAPSSSTSTYSKFTVTAQLLSTWSLMPVYLSSSSANKSRALIGAGRCSLVFLVYVDAAAKYNIAKWPAGGLAGAIVSTACPLAMHRRMCCNEWTRWDFDQEEIEFRRCRRSDVRVIHANVLITS